MATPRWSSADRGKRASRRICRISSRDSPASSLAPPAPTVSPTSSIAADQPAFSRCSTRRRSALPTSQATGNTSRLAISAIIRRPSFFSSITRTQRVKIWGSARVVENDPGLLKKLKPDGYRARVEQAILFTVSAWDTNCPQHIPQRFEAAEVNTMLAERDQRIEDLTKELDRLRKNGAA